MLYKRPLSRFLSLLFLFLLSTCQKGSDPVLDLSHKTLSYEIKGVKYQTGNWEHPNYTDPFVTHGNHRFEIKTSPGDTLVQVILPWRRHDAKPETKDVVITIAESGEEITAKRIIQTNREEGHIIFKADPNIQSYFAYYLPHESTGGYYPKVAYLTIDEAHVAPIWRLWMSSR
jgi:hypothetical protein